MSRVSRLILYFETAQDLIRDRVTRPSRGIKSRSPSLGRVFKHSVKSDKGVPDKTGSGDPPDTGTSGSNRKLTPGIQSSWRLY